MVGLSFGQPLPTGVGTLSLEFRGKIVENVDNGLFRQKEKDLWYAFTQFETSSARMVFPCFDEPRFKAPFDIVLDVPRGDAAVASTPPP